MTATAVPWAVAEVDPDRVADGLRRRFPGVCVWFGEFTGQWWALTWQGLVEAPDPVELGRRLEAVRSRPVPVRDVATGSDGRWTGAARPGSSPAVSAGFRHGRGVGRRGWWRRLPGGLVVVEVR